jgi:hypothetical protein
MDQKPAEDLQSARGLKKPTYWDHSDFNTGFISAKLLKAQGSIAGISRIGTYTKKSLVSVQPL